MSRNKIMSLVLISTMLSETLPVVNAYDNIFLGAISVSNENSDLDYEANLENTEDIKIESLDIDNNTIESSGVVGVSEESDIETDSNVVEKETFNKETKNIGNEEELTVADTVEDTVEEKVLEITLDTGQYVPDLTGNPDGYTKIVVTTTGNKKLTLTDYSNLRKSLIPNIDLFKENLITKKNILYVLFLCNYLKSLNN